MNPNPDYDASDELEYGIAAYRMAAPGRLPAAVLRTRPGQRQHRRYSLLSHCGGGT